MLDAHRPIWLKAYITFIIQWLKYIRIWLTKIQKSDWVVAVVLNSKDHAVENNVLVEIDLLHSGFYNLSSIVQKEVLHHLVINDSKGSSCGMNDGRGPKQQYQQSQRSMKYDTTKRLQTFLLERKQAIDKSKMDNL